MGNDAWVLSYREECFEQIGLKPSIKIPLYNGSLECELRKYQMFDGKMKMFRSEGGTVKTDEEKRQMAESHRFKKEREFKQRITEQEENEDGDIRSFTFHRHDIKESRRTRDFKDSREDRDARGASRSWDARDTRNSRDARNARDSRNTRDTRDARNTRETRNSKYSRDSQNRGGHERFDRSGGKHNNKKFNRNDN